MPQVEVGDFITYSHGDKSGTVVSIIGPICDVDMGDNKGFEFVLLSDISSVNGLYRWEVDPDTLWWNK